MSWDLNFFLFDDPWEFEVINDAKTKSVLSKLRAAIPKNPGSKNELSINLSREELLQLDFLLSFLRGSEDLLKKVHQQIQFRDLIWSLWDNKKLKPLTKLNQIFDFFGFVKGRKYDPNLLNTSYFFYMSGDISQETEEYLKEKKPELAQLISEYVSQLRNGFVKSAKGRGRGRPEKVKSRGHQISENEAHAKAISLIRIEYGNNSDIAVEKLLLRSKQR